MMVVVLKLVVRIFLLDAYTGDFGDDSAPPNSHRLVVVVAVHPHGQGSLFAISARGERTLEAEMVTTREGEGSLNLAQPGRDTGTGWLGGEEDVGVCLGIPIFREEVPEQEK